MCDRGFDATKRDDCGLGEPKMSRHRRCGREHGPVGLGSCSGARLPFWEGAACHGRILAIGSRTGRGKDVSRGLLGDGERLGAKESSKKTYEIFLGVSPASGR